MLDAPTREVDVDDRAAWLVTAAEHRLVAQLDPVGRPRPLGDVIIHEQDLRGAVDVSGARETDGLAALRSRMADGFHQAVTNTGLAPVHLVSDAWTQEAGAGEPGLVLTASELDLTLAMTTRRSAAQLGSCVTAGGLEPYLAGFAVLGALPAVDLRD